MGEGVGVGGGVGVDVGLAVGEGEGAGVDVGAKVGTGGIWKIVVVTGAGVSVWMAATRGVAAVGSGESSFSASPIHPKMAIAKIIPTTHEKHPPNLDDPPERESDSRDSERGGAPNSRYSGRGVIFPR